MVRSKFLIPAIAAITVLGFLFNCEKNPVDNNNTPAPGSTSNGYFYISNPVNGLSYSISTYDSILWTWTPAVTGAYVSIYLYNDTQLVSTVSTGTYNDGSYTYWYIPNVGSGNRFHIKIVNSNDASQYDFGGYFTLYSSYFGTYSFQNPVDSTVWQAGNSYAIQWQYTGAPGTYVVLQLYNDSTYYSSITTLTSNSTGSYTWTIPGGIASGSNYRIKILSYYDAGLYSFSEKFTIAGVDPDAFENDNTRDSAKTAVSGVLQQHSNTSSDTDWVRIDMDSGKTYIIQDSGVAYFYTSLRLYYGTETTYTSNYSTSTLTWQYACTRSGTYYMKIYPYYSGYTGSYTFKVTEFDPYTAVTFSSPTSSVPWTAGSTYTISWTPDVGMFSNYIELYLYKGNSLVYTIDTYDANDGSYSFTVPTGYVTGSDYRIRLVNDSYSSIYAWSDSFTISGVAPDAYEYDDTLGAAKSITTDGVVQSRTLSYNNYDYISFTAEKDSIYCIQGSTLYMYLYLYNSAGTSLTYNYGYGPKILWTCPTSGTYYLRVSQYSTSYYGSYGIYVRKYSVSSSSIFTSPVAGTPWNAGTSYSVTWNADTSLLSSYIALYLYKGNSLVYSIDTYDANDGSYSFTVPGFTSGNDYHIRLVNYDNTSIYATSDSFTISGVAPDAYEFDDTLGAAKSITTDGIAQARTLSYNNYDYISFTAEKDSIYCIQGSTLYMYLYLYNSAGTSLTYNYGLAPKVLWTCTTSGTYYLRVSQYSTSYYGSYGIYIRKYSPASSSIFTSPLAGAAWSAGSAYPVTWSVDTSLLGSYVNLYLYKGNQLAYTYSYLSNNGSYSFTVPAGFATGSDCHIRLANYNVTSIYATSDSFSISGVAPDAYEFDDTLGAAKPITTDGVAQGRTLSYGNYDYISFTAEKDSIYCIQGSSQYMYIYLYNSTGTSITYNYYYAPKILWTCTASGTYYVRVSQYSTSYYGSYGIFVRKYSPASSSSIFTSPVAGTPWNAGTSYSVTWNADTSLLSSYIALYMYKGNSLVYSIDTYDPNDGSYTFAIPAGFGTSSDYHIRLVNYNAASFYVTSDSFSISGIAPDSYEPDNSAATAHTIATDGTAESHTLTVGDKDWYSFSGTANLLYVMRSHGVAHPALYLYNTDGTSLLSSSNTGFTDTIGSVVWMCPATGTYYLRDSAYTTSYYGSYSASVTTYDSASYSFSVTQPAAGDTLTIGAADTITWSSTVPIGGNVDIYLYNSSGIIGTVVAGTANDGEYIWTAGTILTGTATAGDTYYIRIFSLSYPAINGNSGVFSLQ
jgi:hypothetical protein